MSRRRESEMKWSSTQQVVSSSEQNLAFLSINVMHPASWRPGGKSSIRQNGVERQRGMLWRTKGSSWCISVYRVYVNIKTRPCERPGGEGGAASRSSCLF